MNDLGRRVNSIIVKNLPTNYNESQLEELFSKFGRILSSKMLPTNPNFDGGCGFVNYAEADSCTKAVENMNNFVVDRYTLRVNHSSTRMAGNTSDRPQNGFRVNGESNDENHGASSPGVQNRFSGFRPASARSLTSTTPSKINELETSPNNNKPLWNSTNTDQRNNKSPFQNETTLNIDEHDSFVINKIYAVYLSNLEVPNVIFAATLDDYVNAALLITQMNKHEQLTKIQANSYKSKLTVGQYCAALFNGDWYRARILEIDENRVRVQYIDWGNTGWCDSILEIRPLPNEYYKDSVLCVKCILDEIPTKEKPSDEQTNAILEILVLDTKLDMVVSRIENGLPYVQLNLGERNLNAEIRALLPKSSTSTISKPADQQTMTFDSNKPDMTRTEIHSVQLTTVDAQTECFHVLLMTDHLPTIMNILKDWNATKQPLTAPPKPQTLVCAQYEGDDLWYRAWIQTVTETGFHVYFVDFGNEEVVPIDRLSECPESLRNIPWQSVQIKLAHIQLTDDERYSLLKDFETDQLKMQILFKNQDIYSVELSNNGKSLTDYMKELRRQKEQLAQDTFVAKEVTKEAVEQPVRKMGTPPPNKVESVSRKLNESENFIREDSRKFEKSNSKFCAVALPVSLSIQPTINELKRSTETNENKILSPPPNSATPKPSDVVKTVTKPLSSKEHSNDTTFNDNLTIMITEQRRQNRLLEQVIAAINTSNALLTQLVQR